MVSCRSHMLSPEIVEMVVAHLVYDIVILRACAATCSSWYSVATPYFHHTLTFWTPYLGKPRREPNRLEFIHKLGLLPLVKKLQFDPFRDPRVTPDVSNSLSMRHLYAMVNLQDLAISNLDLSEFPVGARNYFGHILRKSSSCRRVQCH